MKAKIDDETRKFIENKISTDVIEKIELLQRIGNISFPERKSHIMNLRNLFVQITDDLSIIFLVLIERLTALQIQDRLQHSELKKTAEECLFLYAPIAQRLGISKIYNPMEDIAFRILYPNEFKRLNSAIESKRKYFLKKLSAMAKEVNDLLTKNNIPVKLQSRVKRPYSVYRKIHNKSVSLDEIYDLLALRVISDSSENCYQALGLVHSNWNPVQGRFRDWITFPKKKTDTVQFRLQLKQKKGRSMRFKSGLRRCTEKQNMVLLHTGHISRVVPELMFG
jgi:guanosine-3',5'-bis(diphosphate) 3'-pyrophosphohydrolase